MFAELALIAFGQRVGAELTPTAQRLHPYGNVDVLGSRPVALAGGASDDRRVFVKDDKGVRVFGVGPGGDARLNVPAGTSMTGLLLADGTLYTTDAKSGLLEIDATTLKLRRTISLPKPKAGGEAYGCGIAKVGTSLFVCGSRGNELIEIDARKGAVRRRLSISPAPYEVSSVGPHRLAIACWGRKAGDHKASSSGTDVEVDERGIGTGGTLAIVDTEAWKIVREVPVGAMPTALTPLSGGRIAVACANADTLEVLLPTGKLRKTVLRANPDDTFGSAPNGLFRELLHDGKEKLYVTLGGANAVAVLDVAKGNEKVEGFIPTGWYPGPIAAFGSDLCVGNIKGKAGARGVYEFLGTLQRFPRPNGDALRELTKEVRSLAAAPREVAVRRRVVPKPVPARLGDPSPIQHIVYIIKENRTYDQVLGDMKEGDGDPDLCVFGEKVTPNAHALARDYVLLDNYYCNGVNSADGHAWSIEGNATAYFERSFGGWTRSYPFGDDPLATTSTGYLWDHVLAGGLSFRNHGEYDYAEPLDKKITYRDLLEGKGRRFSQNIGVERLRRYSSNVPGWNMEIPDQVRVERFLEDLRQAESRGTYPNFSILYLPEDHTNGTAPGRPTPRALVADNDFAVGRAIAGLSKSKFWKKMAVFVIEDDPQAGFDHVDGHRSTCLVVSPYTKGRGKDSRFYNQTSVLRTMFRILGLGPRTRFEAASPLMGGAFVSRADPIPYRARTPEIPLTEVNPAATSLRGPAREDALASAKLPLEEPDRIEDDRLNRILWRNRKPGIPYPKRFAGAHGRGLRKKGLALDIENDD